MSRQQKREKAEALSAQILGDDYRFTRVPSLAKQRAAARRRRAREVRRREMATTSWTPCVVPGCKFTTQRTTDGDIDFPVCWVHAVVAWEFINRHLDDPNFTASSQALRARREQILLEQLAEEAQADADYSAGLREGTILGEIYIIRQGSLIKVGWTSNLEQRLRHYGPGIEVLCVYPGSRQDEALLHRQLSPARAKGREWYHDGPIIADHVTRSVAEHGPPDVEIRWTEPKPVIGR